MSAYSTRRQVQNVLEGKLGCFRWDEPPSRLEVAMHGFLAILEFLREGDRQEFLDAIAQDDWESIGEWTARLRQEWEPEEKEDEDDD